MNKSDLSQPIDWLIMAAVFHRCSIFAADNPSIGWDIFTPIDLLSFLCLVETWVFVFSPLFHFWDVKRKQLSETSHPMRYGWHWLTSGAFDLPTVAAALRLCSQCHIFPPPSASVLRNYAEITHELPNLIFIPFLYSPAFQSWLRPHYLGIKVLW